MVHHETSGCWTDGVVHYARYFCIDLCRFYFSSCTCVAAYLVRYLRQCSAANPADIYVPPCVVYGGRLRSHIVMTVLSFKKNPILYFMPVLILLFVRLCVYYINTS